MVFKCQKARGFNTSQLKTSLKSCRVGQTTKRKNIRANFINRDDGSTKDTTVNAIGWSDYNEDSGEAPKVDIDYTVAAGGVFPLVDVDPLLGLVDGGLAR